MPQLWAYGGGALDEAEAAPTYKKVLHEQCRVQGGVAGILRHVCAGRSVPVSALTNTQTENQDPFIAGQLGMMISHPVEYATMLDRAKKATGDDRKVADAVVANMRYGLVPKGPARRAVVFGGSNLPHVRSGSGGRQAGCGCGACLHRILHRAGMVHQDRLGGIEPGHRLGFRTIWMKQRLEQIKFLNVTTSMLPSGVPLPGDPGIRRDHEHHRAEHDAERADAEDDGGGVGRRRGRQGFEFAGQPLRDAERVPPC